MPDCAREYREMWQDAEARIAALTADRATDRKIITAMTFDECECVDALAEYDAEGITLIERIEKCKADRDEARERAKTPTKEPA